ncbi:hypothetical protein PLICRDRAFT_174263 [Plicaturopsis crispa FD-325 SS-3]|nr:hypothetical protein PLICRDRAFT_174263 [Plicaturopsis crispa FD-325 SS-3]
MEEANSVAAEITRNAANDADLSAYIHMRRSIVQLRRKFRESALEWEARVHTARCDLMYVRRLERRKAIMRRLRQMDRWHAELEFLDACYCCTYRWCHCHALATEFWRLPIVRNCEMLTDRDWNNIEPAIMKYLSRVTQEISQGVYSIANVDPQL